MWALTVGKVVKTSNESKAPVGLVWSCFDGVQEYVFLPIEGPVVPDVPPGYNDSIFSVVIGLTAWVGTSICSPKNSETMLVSSAAVARAVATIAYECRTVAAVDCKAARK